MNNFDQYLIKTFSFLTILVFCGFSEVDLSYNPYPVIVVHGFGSSPGETWGLKTNKDEEEDLLISTLIDEEDTKKHDIKIARDLINEYEGFKAFKRTYNDTGIGFIHDRFIPYEEENSYSGFNHTFVEAYCSYFRFESNDKKGVRFPTFTGSGVDDPVGYDISEGGQTRGRTDPILALI